MDRTAKCLSSKFHVTLFERKEGKSGVISYALAYPATLEPVQKKGQHRPLKASAWLVCQRGFGKSKICKLKLTGNVGGLDVLFDLGDLLLELVERDLGVFDNQVDLEHLDTWVLGTEKEDRNKRD
jgi:hypothetical protein